MQISIYLLRPQGSQVEIYYLISCMSLHLQVAMCNVSIPFQLYVSWHIPFPYMWTISTTQVDMSLLSWSSWTFLSQASCQVEFGFLMQVAQLAQVGTYLHPKPPATVHSIAPHCDSSFHHRKLDFTFFPMSLASVCLCCSISYCSSCIACLCCCSLA